MKKLLLCLYLLVFTHSALASEFYIAPNGTASGDGSINNPWDIVTAFKDNTNSSNKNFVVKAGDTIWIKGGKYNGAFVSFVTGSVVSPVIIRQYPGERVTLDNNTGGNTNTLLVKGSYVWYMDFEVTNTSTPAPWNNLIDYPGAHHLKFINLILHDAGVSGIGPSNASADIEVYGCLFYYNGRGPAPNHGYGVYLQNSTPEGKSVRDSIFVNNWGWYGLHSYGEGGAINNLTMEGNTLVNNSIVLGGFSVAQNGKILNNYTYRDDSSNSRTIVNIGYLGWGAGTSNAVVRGNYFAGGATVFRSPFTGLTFTGNTIYGYLFQSAGTVPDGGVSTPWPISAWPNNTYHLFHGGVTPAKPADQVFVRKNAYDPNRANITIFNWKMLSNVSVDLSSVLSVGDTYRIQDAQNYWGPPAASGTYSGGLVTVPMNLTEIVKPFSYVAVNIPTTHTSTEFGAFILIKGGVTVPPPPPPPSVDAVQIYLEAEAGTLVAPMSVLANAQASGGQYVASPTSDIGSVQFSVNITVPGIYVIWCRVLSSLPSGDSVFVSIDGQTEDIYDMAEGTWSTNWQWTKVNGRNGSAPLTVNPRLFNLSLGQHTLFVRNRESGASIDRLLITNDLTYLPVDTPTTPLPPVLFVPTGFRIQ